MITVSKDSSQSEILKYQVLNKIHNVAQQIMKQTN